MFRTNAFGQRINCMPRLRFVDTPPDKGGGAGDQNKSGEDSEQNGFPAGTPLEQMTVEQREAYWKHQARKHENVAKGRQDYDDLKAKAEQFDQLQQQNQTNQERAIAEARDEARREGENLGAERYLKDAVTARFEALTGKSQEEVEKAFAHIDVHSFVGQDGAIDTTALTEFASTFGTASTSTTPPADPVKAALERQRQAPGGSSGSGSIAEMKKARVEALTAKKQ